MSLVIPEIFIDTDLESKWSELNIYEQKKLINTTNKSIDALTILIQQTGWASSFINIGSLSTSTRNEERIQGPLSSVPKSNGVTTLMANASLGNTEYFKLIIKNNPYRNQQDNYKWSALHYASKNGHIDIIKLLFSESKGNQKPTNINICDNQGCSPIHYAKNKETVSLLFKYGADITLKDSIGSTPLHNALNASVANQLILFGSQINKLNLLSDTPLITAIKKNRIDVVRELCKHLTMKQINYIHSYNSAIHIATNLGYLDIIKELINVFADVNNQNYRNQTPLHLACIKADQDNNIIKYLLDNGADPEMIDLDQKNAIHHLIINSINHNKTVYIAKMIISKIDYDKQHTFVNTCYPNRPLLMMACIFNNLPLTKLLIENYNAHINYKLPDGKSSLTIAMNSSGINNNNDFKPIINYLQSKGAL